MFLHIWYYFNIFPTLWLNSLEIYVYHSKTASILKTVTIYVYIILNISLIKTVADLINTVTVSGTALKTIKKRSLGQSLLQ